MSDSQSTANSILTSLISQSATWFVGLVMAILAIFSSQLTESIKFALNKADLRTKQHEELATEVSKYIFAGELTGEFIENGWTTKPTLTELIADYNKAVTVIRNKEYVYLAWIQKYWGSNEAKQFESFMVSLRDFDAAIHSLNDEFEAVNITATQKKVSDERAKECLQQMKPALKNMQEKGKALLTSLA